MVNDTVSLTLPTKSDYAGVVRLMLSGICSRMDYSITDIENIKLAVSEAYANVIKHAFKKKPESDVTVKFYVLEHGLKICIHDNGDGFDVNGKKTNYNFDDLDDPSVGMGVGLTFIESLMDELNIDSTIGTGTVVTMFKKKSSCN
ncbi:hypothetical protein CL648_04090 [bacterium]|nr:hypothetical protein [bacterium]|tara:strand:+ start:18501 stop:18935 length:435 start_codon:yes stop_codon:yes gene_type:complete